MTPKEYCEWAQVLLCTQADISDQTKILMLKEKLESVDLKEASTDSGWKAVGHKVGYEIGQLKRRIGELETKFKCHEHIGNMGHPTSMPIVSYFCPDIYSISGPLGHQDPIGATGPLGPCGRCQPPCNYRNGCLIK